MAPCTAGLLAASLLVTVAGFRRQVDQSASWGVVAEEKADEVSEKDCQEECKFSSLYTRWHSQSHGFVCWVAAEQRAVCRCAGAPVRPADCPPVPAGQPSLAALGAAAARRGGGRRGAAGGTLAPQDGPAALQLRDSGAAVAASTADAAETPRDTVTNFCDGKGLREMRGESAAAQLESGDAFSDMEGKIMGDIAKELESNNVDKMAKEIFSFYVCARWAPDAVFWKLAEQELPAQMAEQVLGDQSDTKENLVLQGIAEMYKDYKFVPLLCSKNLQVFDEMDPTDHTYFRKFATDAGKLTTWLTNTAAGMVGQGLASIDKAFCGDKPMNQCSRDSMMQWIKDFLRLGQTTGSMFAELKKRIAAFQSGPTGSPEEQKAWAADFADWKHTFPYHSFIAKPDGFQGNKALSPRADERFMVCFGKRVASELHRRPNGQHILTDQNNIGCHGWYTSKEAGEQIQRMVKLWRPPTCQLAEMTYVMKKEILAKFAQMNQRLFDALPSIINDELEDADKDDKWFNWEEQLPKPFNPKEFVDTPGKRTLVDGMRVRAAASWCLIMDGNRCKSGCQLNEGELGTVRVADQKLRVEWIGAHLNAQIRSPLSFEVGADRVHDLQILPDGWLAKRSVQSHVRDIVAGLNSITDRAKELFNSMFAPKQTNLADLMSGSVSKWAVCPIKDTANLNELDSWLGVEDAAFQDFQKDAYKKWTGFQKEIPGEKCVAPGAVLGSAQGFEKASVCEINELHANHVEKFTNASGQLEAFTCPLRPPLPADEQLTVLAEKKETCFLRMTGRQEQQFSWHYQGFFPARRQYERKANDPRVEFELVKLLNIPGDGIQGEASFGRYCSVQELLANPRFCDLPKVLNEWNSLADVARSLADSLRGLNSNGNRADVVAPLGVGATAVASTLATIQDRLRRNLTDNLKDAAVAIGERTWDDIRGAGRLLRATGQWVVAHAQGELPGADRMALSLEERLFASGTNGELLHSLSFQRAIGTDGKTSNAKERFQRYVVTYPCPSFDPAFQFSLRRRWGRIAVRLVKEAYAQNIHKAASVLDAPSLNLAVRGEGMRYVTTADRRAWYSLGASMLWRNDANPQQAAKCEVRGDACFPAHLCDRSRGWLPPWNVVCTPRDWWASAPSSGWWPVGDGQISEVVAPVLSTGHIDPAELLGFEMALYCAPKKDFGPSGEPKTLATKPLRECLMQGVVTNALLRAREPWKLYFPEEVVVVAAFTPIEKRLCRPSRSPFPDGELVNSTDAAALCSGAQEDRQLGAHLLDAKGQPHKSVSSTSGTFMGLHAGAGVPKGTLEEVVLRPEDILEALELIGSSNGR